MSSFKTGNIARGGSISCMSKTLIHTYDDIISVENLLFSWKEFLKGKRGKKDVQEFQLRLMDNIFELHADLKNRTYKHGSYQLFKINDPKPRDIHKASVRDRLLHHVIYRALYPYFDSIFISDSYSCRNQKGTHKAMERFQYFVGKVSKNNTQKCSILKCDIQKFFASINHSVLKNILTKHIKDRDILALLSNVIDSFNTERKTGVGLPLGNLTSQLLVNIHMNEFDQYVKHVLKEKQYIRYADDFVFIGEDSEMLKDTIPTISEFLDRELKLQLHPDKVLIKTISSGIDFLGWVHFPEHRVLRTATKRRMIRNIQIVIHKDESIESYKGMLKYGNRYILFQKYLK